MGQDKDYEKFLVNLSDNIKEKRSQMGITQEEMAEFGFNYRHYQRLESGIHSPSLSTLFKLASIFNVEVSELFKKNS